MLDALRSLFAAPGATRESLDVTEAMAAILVEIAQSDGDYAASERHVIDRILADRFDLKATAAATLRERGEAAQAKATDLHRFADALNKSLEQDARIGAIELFWEVALADGERHEAENALLRLIAGLLHVPDQESALARHRALGHLLMTGWEPRIAE